jgi:hypothetical protein
VKPPLLEMVQGQGFFRPLTRPAAERPATLSHEGRGDGTRGSDTVTPLPLWEREGPTAFGGGRVRGIEWERSKRAGGAGRGRARCGGDGQRHGNLLERADFSA